MVFKHYIEKPYKHLIIGNTEEAVNSVKETAKAQGIGSQLYHLNIPFAKVEDFDYEGIAKQVNEIKPDMIWVSLGAPKQERFMSKLLPRINSGVMFGIGAAVNYYIGTIESSKNPKLMWVKRIQSEPKKQLKRAVDTFFLFTSNARHEGREVPIIVDGGFLYVDTIVRKKI